MWKNADSVPHTVSASDGSWTSGDVAPGASFARRFVVTGVVTHHSEIHPATTGTVVVKAMG